MKKILSVVIGSTMLVGAGLVGSPASASGGWLDGSNRYSDCYVESERITLQYNQYEKWCKVDFNPVTVALRGVVDGGVYKVEEWKQDIYGGPTFDHQTPLMVGQIW